MTTPMNIPPSTQDTSGNKILESSSDVIRDLEKRGEDYIINNNPISSPDKLIELMKNGADEFKKRTGQPMTYAEMRAAYG